jgi:hypothetical protein
LPAVANRTHRKRYKAIASETSGEGVTLAGVRIVTTPQHARTLFRDDNYAIIWNGFGYHTSSGSGTGAR